ncbi:MAG TPA: RNA chaperone Hfq [Gammaproteobacteria bacterium]|nr:RNA chaperone Hfq [Gammaproteobacteria bacterium]
MSDSTSDFQRIFLNALVIKKAPVAIYLKNGIKLKGTIKGFDSKSILLDHPSQQVIYTSAVSTVAPLVTLAMTEET